MFGFFFGIMIGIVLGLTMGVIATGYLTEGFQSTANGSGSGSGPDSDDPNEIIAAAYANVDVKKMGMQICSSFDKNTKDFQDRLRKDPANAGKFMTSSTGEKIDYVTGMIQQHDKFIKIKKDALGCP
jgi:hypothetical protein